MEVNRAPQTKSDQPILLLMCGLPFAGKTTLATALAERFGWQYISLDAINTERGMGLNGRAIEPDEWSETYSEALLDSARPTDLRVAMCYHSFVSDQTKVS